jgi:hypothetical protein
MENKLEKYYDIVSDSLLNGTKHWSNDTHLTHHIGVKYPMYSWYEKYNNNEELEFYYTENEIKEWLREGKWIVGSDDIKYLNDVYGLTKEESSIVMNIYVKKLSSLLLSRYGR